MKTDVNLPSKNNTERNFEKNTYFLLASCQQLTKKAGSGSESVSGPISPYRADPDPDLYQNVTNPPYWIE
jgi:hypothetical protein